MEIQELPLALGEPSNIYNSLRIDAHPLQRRQMCDRGDDKLSRIFKANKSPIKKVIDARRE